MLSNMDAFNLGCQLLAALLPKSKMSYFRCFDVFPSPDRFLLEYFCSLILRSVQIEAKYPVYLLPLSTLGTNLRLESVYAGSVLRFVSLFYAEQKRQKKDHTSALHAQCAQ